MEESLMVNMITVENTDIESWEVFEGVEGPDFADCEKQYLI
jgi:hypothetical protein